MQALVIFDISPGNVELAVETVLGRSGQTHVAVVTRPLGVLDGVNVGKVLIRIVFFHNNNYIL